MSRFVALTCSALARSIYALAATSPHTVTVRLFEQGLHNQPKNLRSVLQAQIDSIQPGECDAILLVYGMCGTATIGLTTQHTPLVIPRAHDCITLYLGSKERYQEEFEAQPGTYWYSVDYVEHLAQGSSVALGAASIEAEAAEYERYVAKFGKETADLLIEELRKWSQHYTRAVFVDMGSADHVGAEAMARQKAEREGWLFERIQGNRRLLELLVNGTWQEDDFLVVAPGQRIEQTYDAALVKGAALLVSATP